MSILHGVPFLKTDADCAGVSSVIEEPLNYIREGFVIPVIRVIENFQDLFFTDALAMMPYRILCNSIFQKSQEARFGLDLASSHCTSLHNNRYAIIPHLKPEKMQEVCKRVKSCNPHWKSNRWEAFKGYLERTCKNSR